MGNQSANSLFSKEATEEERSGKEGAWCVFHSPRPSSLSSIHRNEIHELKSSPLSSSLGIEVLYFKSLGFLLFLFYLTSTIHTIHSQTPPVHTKECQSS